MSAPTYQIKLCQFEGSWPLEGKPYGMIAQIFPDDPPLMGVLFKSGKVWAQLDDDGQVLALDQALVSSAIGEASGELCNKAIDANTDFINSLGREDLMVDFSTFRFPLGPPRNPGPKTTLEPTASSFYIAPPKPPKPNWA